MLKKHIRFDRIIRNQSLGGTKMAFTWKEIILFIASLLMIVIVLLQDTKQDSSRALTGEKSGLFANQKARGFELIMTWITLGISVLFIVFAILKVAL